MIIKDKPELPEVLNTEQKRIILKVSDKVIRDCQISVDDIELIIALAGLCKKSGIDAMGVLIKALVYQE